MFDISSNKHSAGTPQQPGETPVQIRRKWLTLARGTVLGLLAGTALFASVQAARDIIPSALDRLNQAVTVSIWTHALETKETAQIIPAYFAEPTARTWQMRRGASGDLILDLDEAAHMSKVAPAMTMLGCLGEEWSEQAQIESAEPHDHASDTSAASGLDQFSSGDVITLTTSEGKTYRFRVEKNLTQHAGKSNVETAPRLVFHVALPDGKAEITLQLLSSPHAPKSDQVQQHPQREL
jgi:hypothetical protein